MKTPGIPFWSVLQFVCIFDAGDAILIMDLESTSNSIRYQFEHFSLAVRVALDTLLKPEKNVCLELIISSSSCRNVWSVQMNQPFSVCIFLSKKRD